MSYWLSLVRKLLERAMDWPKQHNKEIYLARVGSTISGADRFLSDEMGLKKFSCTTLFLLGMKIQTDWLGMKRSGCSGLLRLGKNYNFKVLSKLKKAYRMLRQLILKTSPTSFQGLVIGATYFLTISLKVWKHFAPINK